MTTATPTTIAFSVVSQWFDASKGLATGCVTLGAPLGGIFFSLVLQTLFRRFSWRTAGLVLTGIMAFFLLLGNLLIETNMLIEQEKTASEGGEEGDDERGDTLERPATISQMLRSPKFWLISYALFGKPRVSLLVHPLGTSASSRGVQCLLLCDVLSKLTPHLLL
jgi:MFS family permease